VEENRCHQGWDLILYGDGWGGKQDHGGDEKKTGKKKKKKKKKKKGSGDPMSSGGGGSAIRTGSEKEDLILEGLGRVNRIGEHIGADHRAGSKGENRKKNALVGKRE